MSLKYYRKENDLIAAKYPALNSSPITFADAVVLIRRLAEEHGVAISSIEATSGSRRSVWNPGPQRVRLNTSWLCWGTAIHEFAHALDGKLRPDSKCWHDSKMLELVDDLCRIVVERGWHLSIPEERRVQETAMEVKRSERAAASAAREALERDPKNVRARKIERRRVQVARLEASIKACWVREKMLNARLARARRSLTALERAQDELQEPRLVAEER